MIHSVGDSHAQWSFKRTGIVEHEIGAVTMQSIGKNTSVMLDTIIAGLGITQEDTIIMCCGEIDARCHIQPRIDAGEDEDQIVSNLVANYIERLVNSKFKNMWVLSVTPAWDYASWEEFIIRTPGRSVAGDPFPLRGSDGDRARYTKKMNSYLQTTCAEFHIPFVDVYDFYSDDKGMLIRSLSDGTLHIGDTRFVKQVLDSMGVV